MSLPMKVAKDMAIRCSNSVPMTLHRPLQQLLGNQVEHKYQIKKKLRLYFINKDRLDYGQLGFDDTTFAQKLRANYESCLSNALRT